MRTRRELLKLLVLSPLSALSAKVFGKQLPIVGTDAPATDIPTIGRAGLNIIGPTGIPLGEFRYTGRRIRLRYRDDKFGWVIDE